jgi:hypothetical protein
MSPQELISYLEGMGASSPLEIIRVLENPEALEKLGIDDREAVERVHALATEEHQLDLEEQDRCLSDYADA